MFTDVNARARGLATHRLELPDVASPAEVERALRARAGRELRVLARWAGDRRDVLAVVFDDEDVRSLRGIVRGLAAGAPFDARTAGAVPTPTLPARLIDALAREPTIAGVAARASKAGHPYAGCLAAAVGATVDPLAFETAAARRLGERAQRRAAAGGAALVDFVARRADIDNATAALLLAERGAEIDPRDWFVPGGDRLSRDRFAAACAGPRNEARERLSAAFAGTALAEPLRAGDFIALEDAALGYQLASQARWRRLEPHGAGPILWLVLQRRREAAELRRAAWRRALTGGAGPGVA